MFGERNSYYNPIAVYPNYNIVVFILIHTISGSNGNTGTC